MSPPFCRPPGGVVTGERALRCRLDAAEEGDPPLVGIVGRAGLWPDVERLAGPLPGPVEDRILPEVLDEIEDQSKGLHEARRPIDVPVFDRAEPGPGHQKPASATSPSAPGSVVVPSSQVPATGPSYRGR